MVVVTSYLDTIKIILRKSILECLVTIRQDDVTWRHMTSFSGWTPKNWWRHQQFGYILYPIIIFWQLSDSFSDSKWNKMRGQRTFYNGYIKSYYHFHICRILMTSSLKWRPNDVKMTSQQKLWYHLKVCIGLYNWCKFHGDCIMGTLFSDEGALWAPHVGYCSKYTRGK